MSDNEDCKACETIFAAHQDERPAILLSQLNALHSKYTLHVAGHVLAAAEERGRRAGIEERDREWLMALWTWKRYSPECLSNLGDIQRASSTPAPCPGCIPLRALVAAALAPQPLPRDVDRAPRPPWACDCGNPESSPIAGGHAPDCAALAPRDSGPVCDVVVSSDPFREWRCGKPKDHEGPHSGEAPRDSEPAPGCLCQGGKTQPYCAYCLGMSAPRDSGKGAK